MTGKSIQDGGSDSAGENKGRGRRVKASKGTTGCRNNSRTSSPASTGTTSRRNEVKNEEKWDCEICKKSFKDPDDKLLECERCSYYYCIKCLKKSEEEYRILENSDIMWFCAPCKEKVEKNIIVDREIEDRCKDMMELFDNRIQNLEEEMKKKCSKDYVLGLVQEEITKCVNTVRKDETKAQTPPLGNETDSENQKEDVTAVLKEINERKKRECNMIIYGAKECRSEENETRRKHDIGLVQKLSEACGTNLEEESVMKTVRLGRFDKEAEEMKRPLLVTFSEAEQKVAFFKKAGALKTNKEYEKVRLANDLTKSEREAEKKLYLEAKELKEKSGEYTFKVRGPPWARRIVKLKKV